MSTQSLTRRPELQKPLKMSARRLAATAHGNGLLSPCGHHPTWPPQVTRSEVIGLENHADVAVANLAQPGNREFPSRFRLIFRSGKDGLTH
jgi:hypothetical protein